jgi:hypothetical protein
MLFAIDILHVATGGSGSGQGMIVSYRYERGGLGLWIVGGKHGDPNTDETPV